MSPGSAAVAVIGAGPAGLAAAYELVKAGIRVDVFERTGELGGLARSLNLWDDRMDLGSHVIAGGDPAAVALWNEIAGAQHELPLRRALLRQGRLVEYPPTALGILRGLRLPAVLGCALDLAAARLRRTNGGSSESAKGWFVSRYGAAFYRQLLENYIRKLWGRDGADIDASYLDTVAHVAREQVTVPGHAGTMSYPRDGLSAAWERLAARIARGGTIHFNATVDAVCVRDGAVSGVVVGGETRSYDAVLSAAPVRPMLAALPDVPADVLGAAARLQTRHVIAVHLRVRSPSSLRHAWIVVDDVRLAVGRVSDSRFWHNATARESAVLSMEYWCAESDPVWTEGDAEIGARASRELEATGLLPGARVDGFRVTRLRGALPVPTVGYQRDLARVRSFMGSVRGLETMGRHGSFAFDSTMSSMADGIAAARRVLASPFRPRADAAS